MRPIWRSVERDLLRDAAALGAAVIMVGVSFGALAVAAGIRPWLAIGMSLLVFSGGAQFLVLGVMASGGAAAAAVVGGLLLNARHLPFGLAVSRALGRGWPARLIGSHLLVDETVAFATAQRDPRRARRAYWTAGLVLFAAWNTGTVIGVLAGQAVGDPRAYGVDAAFPAGLLALLLPSLRGWDARRVALTGAALAMVAVPLLPAGLPVLLALAALLAAGRVAPGRSRPPADPGGSCPSDPSGSRPPADPDGPLPTADGGGTR